MKAEVVAAHKGGMWAWLFQRITAVLLILCLALHLVLTHILNIGELNYGNVANRLAHASLTAVDIILLAAGIYHALNGLRMVLMDYWFGSRRWAVALSIVLWVVGLAAMGYGTWALWPWIS
ncbi:MAG: succinate dehydrogenase, hydrophobic membrane anchor protein [Actinobacteria bacterium RBG_13_63_9]|nr:MAG: succinate dehydrogenase, hydrophobic membrane anchor protein [Actinobacteria bacterium RBG_13_63_9]